jgi:hypothetical protein
VHRNEPRKYEQLVSAATASSAKVTEVTVAIAAATGTAGKTLPMRILITNPTMLFFIRKEYLDRRATGRLVDVT